MEEDVKHKVVGMRDAILPGDRESLLNVEKILSRPQVVLSQAGSVSAIIAFPIASSDNRGQCIVPVPPVGRYGVPSFLRNTDDSHSSSNLRRSAPPEESEIRREWNKHNALEIEERRKESNDQQYRILEEAAIHREAFHRERAAQIRVTKYMNREKEEQYYRENLEPRQDATVSNIWKTVVSLTDLDDELPSIMNSSVTPENITAAVLVSEAQRPKSPAEVIAKSWSDAKKASTFSACKRTADVSRMKEVRGRESSREHPSGWCCRLITELILLKLKKQRFAPRTI